MTRRRNFIRQTLSAGAAASAAPLANLAQAATPQGQPGGIVGSPKTQGTWAAATDPVIWQQAWDRRFTNVLPNPLDPNILGIGFVYRPDRGTSDEYTVWAGQIEWDVLGIPGLTTTVWGYGNYEGGKDVPVTFPGRSFVVHRNQPITVKWENRLLDRWGNPVPHLLPVDQTLLMDPSAGGTANARTGVPITVHHHGNDSAFEFDGGPDQWLTPKRVQIGPGIQLGRKTGGRDNANALYGEHGLNYTYTNVQEASLHWYHDHAQGITRINAYAGLAGLYVIRDANEARAIAKRILPAHAYELPLVLQDKIFTADGSLAYSADPADYPDNALDPAFGDNPTHMPEMFGDVICVNGKAWPSIEVEPRQYRLRLLNGADARVFVLSFGNAKVWQVSTDLGLLNKAVPMASVVIAPGERLDVVVDFAGLRGQELIVRNGGAIPFPNGDLPAVDGGTDVVMRFAVTKPLDKTRPLSAVKGEDLRGLAAGTPELETPARAPGRVVTRRVLLGEGTDTYGRITPLIGTYDPTGAANHGTLAFDDPPTETPALGATEVWEFWNATVDAHPIHMHLVQFRVLDRQEFAGTAVDTTMSNGMTGVRLEPGAQKRGAVIKAPAHEQGWKDTVLCPPGMVTRVVTTFNRPGKYVYHCHILSHEEHDMMRWFVVS